MPSPKSYLMNVHLTAFKPEEEVQVQIILTTGLIGPGQVAEGMAIVLGGIVQGGSRTIPKIDLVVRPVESMTLIGAGQDQALSGPEEEEIAQAMALAKIVLKNV